MGICSKVMGLFFGDSERRVGTVAEGGIGAVLAVAEGDGFRFLNGDFLGLEFGTSVGSVAEGLFRGFAARAPPVFPGFEFHDGRAFAGNLWGSFGGHGGLIHQRGV
jgi:hypothetical protein